MKQTISEKIRESTIFQLAIIIFMIIVFIILSPLILIFGTDKIIKSWKHD